MLNVWLHVCYHYLYGGLSHCACQEFLQFKILIPCLSVQSCALLGASNMFIESVLFREYIDCQHQLVALVQ